MPTKMASKAPLNASDWIAGPSAAGTAAGWPVSRQGWCRAVSAHAADDDCTRYRALCLCPCKYHGSSLDFLATVRQALPCPIRKSQVDNGIEFGLAAALVVQETDIRLQHIKPRWSEQNGRVARSHRIDEEEFWSRTTFDEFT